VQRRSAARKLVRRAHVNTVVAAWVITVPASAILAAVIFFALEHLFGVV
jgi:PiT family inorganic phosphate transporter